MQNSISLCFICCLNHERLVSCILMQVFAQAYSRVFCSEFIIFRTMQSDQKKNLISFREKLEMDIYQLFLDTASYFQPPCFISCSGTPTVATKLAPPEHILCKSYEFGLKTIDLSYILTDLSDLLREIF